MLISMLGQQSLLTGGAKVRNQFSSALLYGSQDVTSFMKFLSYHHSFIYQYLYSLILKCKQYLLFSLKDEEKLASHFSSILIYTYARRHTSFSIAKVYNGHILFNDSNYYINIYLYCFKHINTILYGTVQLCGQSQRRVYNPILLNPCGLKENDIHVNN